MEASSSIPPPLAPYTPGSPLDVHLFVQSMGRKADMPQVVINQLVADHFSEAYPKCLQVFTDGSIRRGSKTATAAFSIPALEIELEGRISIETSSSAAELLGIEKALQRLVS